MPGTILGVRSMTVNKTDRYPCPRGAGILGQEWGEINKYTDKSVIFQVVILVLEINIEQHKGSGE